MHTFNIVAEKRGRDTARGLDHLQSTKQVTLCICISNCQPSEWPGWKNRFRTSERLALLEHDAAGNHVVVLPQLVLQSVAFVLARMHRERKRADHTHSITKRCRVRTLDLLQDLNAC